MSQGENRDEALFKQALLKHSPAERAAWLDEACQGEPALRARLELLLEGHFNAQGFLDTLPQPRAQTRLVRPAGELTEKPGDRIGRYKLLQEIGEGGCGVVYMAQQEEPVRRRVALKVIKLGMDTKQVIARFEAERQALALMDHPNIAKVLDGGATDTGRPFFVMELVRGTKITDYCDQNNLKTEQRLELFVQVCNAIQHAHQKGIIHRDIKPSNILVTLHDGVPVPKVIDFGIAKATEQRLTDKTLFTALEQCMGTPAYMSPEQAEMSGLDMDTRSDIYSLGVLLYELLTGKTPFEAKDLAVAGLDEMRRIIREQDPVRPSTRLSTLDAAEQTTAARRRQVAAPKLIHLMRGDLDWIVMKALEKDRTRRYETANGLAVDVQRHLQNEPVRARPPSNLYRFQKMVRRNKLAFAAAAAVTAALVVGLGLSTLLFLKEKAVRQQVEMEAAKSQQVAQFLKDMLKGVGPSVASGRDTRMLKEILDKTAERIGKDLTNQPAVEAELRTTIGEVYVEFGEYPKAETMYREVLAIRRKLFGNEHREVAASLNNLAIDLQDQGKLAEAETMQREALAMQRKLLGNEHRDVAGSLNNLAIDLEHQGKLAEAETMQREALAMKRKLLGNEHRDVAGSLNNLATVLQDQGKLAEAETMQREALAMQRKLLGNEHPAVADSLNNLALVLQYQGKLAEAETMQREALAMRKKLLGNEHPAVADSLNKLAVVLEHQGKLAEAETMQREALAMRRKLLGNEHPDVAASLNNLATVLQDQGKLAEAETMDREALAMRRKLLAVNTRAQSVRRIVFVGSEKSKSVSKSGLFAMNPDGSHLVQLSQDSYAYSPAWSPGQDYIAYTEGLPSTTIHIMDAIGTLNGGHDFKVAQGLSPDWNSDGTKLVFVGTDYNLYTVSVDPAGGTAGAPVPFVVNERGAKHSPNWSPDGSRIAFQGETSLNTEAIFTRNVTTGVEVQLPAPTGTLLMWTPHWSADSTQIAFVAIPSSGSSYICLVKADGTTYPDGTYFRLPPSYPDNKGVQSPTWSPDDSAIALEVHLPIGTTYQNSICLQDLETGAFTVLTPSGLFAASPDWAP